MLRFFRQPGKDISCLESLPPATSCFEQLELRFKEKLEIGNFEISYFLVKQSQNLLLLFFFKVKREIRQGMIATFTVENEIFV